MLLALLTTSSTTFSATRFVHAGKICSSTRRPLVPVAIMVVFRPAASGARQRGGARRPTRRAGQAGDLRLALARARGTRRSSSRTGSGRGALRDKRRPPGGAARAGVWPQLDARGTRGRRLSRCCLHDPALEHNSELVRSVCAAAGPRARERAPAGRASRPPGRASGVARPYGSSRPTRSAAGSSAISTTARSSAWCRSPCPSACSSPSSPTKPPKRARSCAKRATALALALQELRELTHGIHPPLLVERGLPRRSMSSAADRRPPTRVDLTFPAFPIRSRPPPTSSSARR